MTMESKTFKLAKKIFSLLQYQDYEDTRRALRMVELMLPSVGDLKKEKRLQEERQEAKQERDDTSGDLVPADEHLNQFAKAMGRTVPTNAAPLEVEDLTEELEQE